MCNQTNANSWSQNGLREFKKYIELRIVWSVCEFYALHKQVISVRGTDKKKEIIAECITPIPTMGPSDIGHKARILKVQPYP